MINAVLVFNNAGQPRLTKFYTQLETSVQQRLISEIFTLVSHRPTGSCNFLPLPPHPRRRRYIPHALPQQHTTQRRPIARNLPALRNALLHHHLDVYRIASRADRSYTSLCGSAGSLV
ncbi:hypothetical protein VTL71DRAFT_10266 [Oculimacula yallundae]|uniref:AP complex mu/sigma subunit domain-containing protein n=1 Tax=Oculimacula yallundae TaxID=86028 RepID=A0ABR4CT11_9HELO